LSSESFYNTHGVANVRIENNVISNACVNACTTRHASIFLSGRKDHFIENIIIQGNTISGATAQGALGIKAAVKNLIFESNTCENIASALLFRDDSTLSDSSIQKSTDIFLRNNTFKNIRGSAFYLTNGYTGLIQLKNNYIENINTDAQLARGVFTFSTSALPSPEGHFEFLNNEIVYKNPINYFDTCVPASTAASCKRVNNQIRED
jgi:hypothetical protein